jgi:hypothetical protein
VLLASRTLSHTLDTHIDSRSIRLRYHKQPPLTLVNTLQFEFAYLLVKVQEQLLEDDVQYNFVEHFYTGEVVPLTPQVVSHFIHFHIPIPRTLL